MDLYKILNGGDGTITFRTLRDFSNKVWRQTWEWSKMTNNESEAAGYLIHVGELRSCPVHHTSLKIENV